VEVAVYRIALEALANVARHAGAANCRIGLQVGGSVVLTVADDGVGMRQDATPGIGLRSMRERAAELGGSLEVGPRPGGGTIVTARMPLPVEETVP
jgi:signal transduction histidine kinase